MSAALITGAARRIGRAIACELGAAGHAVAIHYHGSAEEAEETARLIEDAGGQAATVRADLSSEEEACGLISAATKALGAHLTCLVNNASMFEHDDISTASEDCWRHTMQVNLRAPFVLSRDFAAVLPEGNRGSIVNIVDQRVSRPSPDFLSYTLSKTGLWTLTEQLARALAPTIRVNAVGPGPVLPSVHQDTAAFEAELGTLPLAHGPSPEEIANAVRFLVESPSITGQMIAVDGGQHLVWPNGANK